jgi:hypothetical protein
MDIDLGEGYKPHDFIYGHDFSNPVPSAYNYWQKINDIVSPASVLYKVAIGSLITVFDEALYVHGKIYPKDGIRLGIASTITQDGLGNIVFSDSISGSVTLASLLASGSGNVVVSGTPSSGQLASWVNATTIQGINSSSLTLSQSQITNLVTDLAGKAPTIHNLVDITNHPVTGLTAGQFLKALSGTTYGFTSHGLTNSDIGLGNVTNYAQVRKISSSTNNAVVRWDGATGALVDDSLMTISDTGVVNIPLGSTYNINGSPHNHAGLYQSVDATLTALAALDASAGFIYQTGVDTFTKYGFSGTGVATSVARSDHNHTGTYISNLATYFGSIAANYIYASPDGLAGSPTFRSLVSGDIPSLAQSKITNLVSDLAGKQSSSIILTTLSNLSHNIGYLYNNGSGVLSWGSPTGTGNVSNIGTPVDNQIAVWTDSTHIEGHTGLVYDSSTGALGVSLIDSGDGSLKHLTISSGDAVGAAGTDAGDLILHAGNAILGDSSSSPGNVYIVPGNPHSSSYGAYIYLGNNTYIPSTVIIGVKGTSTNIDIVLQPKGTTGSVLIYGGLYAFGNIAATGSTHTFGNTGNGGVTLTGNSGNATALTHLTLKGGDTYATSGDLNGGNLYLYGGAPRPSSAGIRGNIYFGTGTAGYLPIKSSETNVVYYDTATGLLTYGAASSGGGGDVYKSSTPVDNQIAVWVDDHTIEGTTGLTFGSSVLAVAGGISLSGNNRIISVANAPASTTGYNLSILAGSAATSTYGGGNLTLRGGDANTSGQSGHVYIYGGTVGTAGNIYFGTGSTGYLPARTTETNIVYYDSTTGKISYGASSVASHALVSSYHTASGLTTGYFLKATSATTFTFAAHGLTYTDVGAAALSHVHAESIITFTDITTNNATTLKHGYLPKLAGGTTNFLRADGTWAIPTGGTNYWQRVGTTLSPATTGDLIRVNTYYIGANSEGILNATSNSSFNISASAGLVGTPTGRNLYLMGGAPYNASGADAGSIYIRGGAAISGDSSSLQGDVYISPGNPNATNLMGSIYLGDSNYAASSVILSSNGSAANVSLNIRSKGASFISIGDGVNNYVAINGPSVSLYTNAVNIGNNNNAIITGTNGTSGSATGKNITLKGGNGYDISGNNAGGSVYMYGGLGNGTGVVGNTLLAYNGSTAYGYVGIRGPANISYSLYVTGSTYSTGSMYATSFVTISDERLKTMIKPLEPKYINIDYKQFRMKTDLGQLRYGVIAQSIQESYPELVRSDKDGMLSVAYMDLFCLEIAQLKKEIAFLKDIPR